MVDSELRQFVDVFRLFPLDIFAKDSLRSFWINGFADVDELVQDYFASFKDSEHYRDLTRLIEDACFATEKLIERFAILNSDGFQIEGPSEEALCNTDDPTSTIDSSSTLNNTFGTGPWSALSKCNISQQSVLAFIFVFLQSECNPDSSDSDRHLCLLAARLYLDLLCLPGQSAYGIFHETIFQNVVNCLNLKGTTDSDGLEKKCVARRGKHAKKATNKKNKQKGPQNICFSDSDEEMEVDLENDEEAATSNSQKRKKCNIPVNVQKKLILEILFSLENALRSVPLKQQIGLVAEKLVELSFWDTDLVPEIITLAPDVQVVRRAQTKNISSQAYRNIIVLCCPIHGDIHFTFCNIFAYLLPCIIMNGAGNAQTIPRNVVLWKEKTTELVVYLIQTFSPSILPAAKMFAQHASTKLADRAEYRSRVSQAVTLFIKNFPTEERVQMIEWFLKLSKSAKTSHRVFSLEVLGSLVKDSNSIPEHSGVSRTDLLKTIVERIDDKSAAVSSKAMGLLSTDSELLEHILDQSHCDIDQQALFNVVVESCSYEKSAIRKTAVHLLETLICHNIDSMTESNLKAISDRALDVNVSVQKQASISMTKILETYPDSNQAQDAWLLTQLPLVCADESSVQEKGMDMIECTIIQPMMKNTDLSWCLLAKISNGSQQDKQQYLRRAFSIWLRQNKVKPNSFLKSITGRMNTCYKQAAWMVLTFLTLGNKLTNLDFVVEACLTEMRQENQDVLVLKHILQVVSQTSQDMPKNYLDQILHELKASCREFRIPVQILPFAFQAIEKIMPVIFLDNFDRKKEEWCASMFQEIDGVFSSSTILEQGYRPDLPAAEEEKLVRSIMTVGEVFQLCPWLLPAKFKLVIHSLLGRPIVSQEIFSPDAFPFSTPQQPGSINAKIKAHAVITWGKLCIGDMDFCKSSLLTSIKELQESPEPSVRNNITVALSDLLIFHPNLTEPYISNMTACLRDESELVRRQTLLVLAKLLKEDYIKWKGTLFYRVLLCYVDESQEIVKMAEYCLLQLLLKRQPHAFSHHFVECIYYLNSYTRNEAFNQFPSECHTSDQFSLKSSPEMRFVLYQFVLRNMPDQERFHLHNQLCQDVLIPLMEGVFPLDKDSSEVIKDTLCVLSSEEIKLTPLAGLHEEEDEGDASLCADAKKAITALIRKQVVQAVLPVIISLKTFLENAHSPLLCYLEKFLKEFLKDFKNELKDIVGENKQLAKEIEFIVKSA